MVDQMKMHITSNGPDIVGGGRREKDELSGGLTTLRCFRSIVVVLTI
jgi:hypothetical protein